MTGRLTLLVALFIVTSCAVGPTYPAGTPCESDAAAIVDGFDAARRGTCRAQAANRFELLIEPEDEPPINDSPWYAFRIEPRRPGQLTITLRYRDGHHRYPPMFSHDGRTWLPIDADDVDVSDDGATARIALMLDRRPVFVAARAPVTEDHYSAWFGRARQRGTATAAVIGHSVAGRPIRYLDSGGDSDDVILLVGRQHPPEVSGASALFVFAETLLGRSELAVHFRGRYRVIVVPLLNPDGVEAGHWRHNLNGVDLNRDWGPFTQPETQAVRDLLDELDASGKRVRLFLDFHSTKRNVFYTQNDEFPTDPPRFMKRWLDRVQPRLDFYPFDNDRNPVSEQANAKNYMYRRYGIPAATYEVADVNEDHAGERAAEVFAEELMTMLLDRDTTYDLLIRGGSVYTGEVRPQWQINLGIRDGVIVSRHALQHSSASQVIDAKGLIVTPGFIDPHTHATATLKGPESRANLNYLTQGVTTVFIGNDGYGVSGGADTLSLFRKQGIGTHVATLAGHGAIRKSIMGMQDREATADEIEAMQRRVAAEMSNGAFGLSTGLFYAPGSYAGTTEVVELAKTAAAYDGIYETHMRSESSHGNGLLAALDETIEIGRAAAIPVHISHLKALGRDVWHQGQAVIDRIEAARTAGVDVTANQYPWRASGTRFSNALVPRWVMADSKQRMRERLGDPALAAEIRTAMRRNLELRGGPDAMLVSAADSRWRGRTLAQIATAMQSDPVSAAIGVILDGDPSIASFVMDPGVINLIAVRPWVMTGSDGSSGHPRLYGTYPKAWQDLVQSGLMTMERFVHRSSGLVADTFGLCRRGYIREGYAADIAIVDLQRFRARATYEEPTELSDGVRYLIIDGVIVIDDYQYTGRLPGKVLKRTDCDD
ncbi:MAG: amidohydrolase family protein [Woeseiaceae bacterium]|nr:amidohydrolase family protein [Woeseiaceae bacterium]